MIIRVNGKWKAEKLKNIYSIKKLVSVEAKISDMKKVAEQSLINTWFASQSYALTNIEKPQEVTLNNFKNRVLVYTANGMGLERWSKHKNLLCHPVTYLCSLMNGLGNRLQVDAKERVM